MKQRILFVDDDRGVLDGLHRMLRDERARWDMSFASSADEAYGFAKGAAFDRSVHTFAGIHRDLADTPNTGVVQECLA